MQKTRKMLLAGEPITAVGAQCALGSPPRTDMSLQNDTTEAWKAALKAQDPRKDALSLTRGRAQGGSHQRPAPEFSYIGNVQRLAGLPIEACSFHSNRQCGSGGQLVSDERRYLRRAPHERREGAPARAAKVNVSGGAIPLGHPLGAGGSELIHEAPHRSEEPDERCRGRRRREKGECLLEPGDLLIRALHRALGKLGIAPIDQKALNRFDFRDDVWATSRSPTAPVRPTSSRIVSMGNIRQNLLFAFLYNSLDVPGRNSGFSNQRIRNGLVSGDFSEATDVLVIFQQCA